VIAFLESDHPTLIANTTPPASDVLQYRRGESGLQLQSRFAEIQTANTDRDDREFD
jgi:hypothetical protein